MNSPNSNQLTRLSSPHKTNVIRATTEECESHDPITGVAKELKVHVQIAAEAIAHRRFERQVHPTKDQLAALVDKLERYTQLFAVVATCESPQFIRCRHHTANCPECRYLPFN